MSVKIDDGNKPRRMVQVKVEGAPLDIPDIGGSVSGKHADYSRPSLDRRHNLSLTSKTCEWRCTPRS